MLVKVLESLWLQHIENVLQNQDNVFWLANVRYRKVIYWIYKRPNHWTHRSKNLHTRI